MATRANSISAPIVHRGLLRRLASALTALAAGAPELSRPPLLRPAPLPALVSALARRRAIFGGHNG